MVLTSFSFSICCCLVSLFFEIPLRRLSFSESSCLFSNSNFWCNCFKLVTSLVNTPIIVSCSSIFWFKMAICSFRNCSSVVSLLSRYFIYLIQKMVSRNFFHRECFYFTALVFDVFVLEFSGGPLWSQGWLENSLKFVSSLPIIPIFVIHMSFPSSLSYLSDYFCISVCS